MWGDSESLAEHLEENIKHSALNLIQNHEIYTFIICQPRMTKVTTNLYYSAGL